jgi:hypothetical protein
VKARRPLHRWEDNIKRDLRETRWVVMDWINLAEDRDQWRALLYTVMGLRAPKILGNSFATGGFSRTHLHGVSCIITVTTMTT